MSTLSQATINESLSLETLIALADSRAGSYTFLSRVWGEEIDEALWQQLRAATFPSLPELPGLDRAYRQVERALQTPPSDALTQFRVEYARLCLGSNRPRGADPYESVHRNPEGLLMQDEWEAVLHLYRELGLARAGVTHESEDHLAVELEAMALLCARQGNALRAGSLPEASWWLEQQSRLLNDHLLQWVPSFVERVEALAQTDLYKCFACLTEEFLKQDCDLIANLNHG